MGRHDNQPRPPKALLSGRWDTPSALQRGSCGAAQHPYPYPVAAWGAASRGDRLLGVPQGLHAPTPPARHLRVEHIGPWFP